MGKIKLSNYNKERCPFKKINDAEKPGSLEMLLCTSNGKCDYKIKEDGKSYCWYDLCKEREGYK